MHRLFISILLCFALLPARATTGDESTDSIGGMLNEVVVTGNSARQRVALAKLGTEVLDLGKLADVPAFFGENDIIKSIALMPGVHGEGEGAGGFEVRGGTASQNLITLDGITLYNPAHVMGVFSTFNDNAISRATLFKGPIPPCYGGASSSVLATNLANGDMGTYHASATIGLLAAKLMVAGPLVKDKLSFAVNARRSYADVFIAMVPKFKGTVMNFYDITAKLRYSSGYGEYVDASFIIAHDNMAIKDVMGMYWGNVGASVNWLKRASGTLTFTTTAAYTDYSPKMSASMMATDQVIREFIRTAAIEEKADLTLGDGHAAEAGFRSELLRVMSAERRVQSTIEKDIRSGWQNALWLNYEGRFGNHFELTAGARLSLFSVLGGTCLNNFSAVGEPAPSFVSRNYLSFEPRASLRYNIDPQHNIKAGAGISTQNLHAIRSNNTSMPFDRYAITSNDVRPERAVNYGIGYAGMTHDAAFDWSVDGYWKTIDNVYDYLDGQTMFSLVNLEKIIKGGKSRSYGVELMLRKNTGRLTGWLSYTFSRTQTRIDGINDGRWYNASNDRRHNLAISANYTLNDRWDFSAAWVYSSGTPLTAPDLKYELDGVTCYYYSTRNGYLTPPTHRLDLSATYTHAGPRFTWQWAFGLYNAYSRLNPFIIYFEDDDTKPSGTRAVQQSLFGLLPSVSYTLKF